MSWFSHNNANKDDTGATKQSLHFLQKLSKHPKNLSAFKKIVFTDRRDPIYIYLIKTDLKERSVYFLNEIRKFVTILFKEEKHNQFFFLF